MEWRTIEGFEDYAVSDTGLVMRIRFKRMGRDNILKPRDNGRGYYRVTLMKDAKPHQLSIHRLVALAFIPNPNNLPFINHKDENPSNNNVDNLEWCDAKYNNNYGTVKERLSKSHKGYKHTAEAKEKISNNNAKAKSKPVYCDGLIFESGAACARYYNISQSSISDYLTGRTPMPKKWQKRNLHFVVDKS